MMRVTESILLVWMSLVVAVPNVASAEVGPVSSDAQATQATAPTAPADPSPIILGTGPSMPPSTDPGMFPPARAAQQPRPLIELHGFTALWLSPVVDDEAPSHAVDTFRLRWAVLRFDAHPTAHLHVLTRVGLSVEVPLLDASISYTQLPYLNVTAGQFRLPLGAAATTLSPQIVMLDRPSYVYAMTKSTFRDLGVMIGSGDAGVLDGALHYRLGVASGNGRALASVQAPAESAEDLLWYGRVLLDARPWLSAPTRLAWGATVAFTHDPALDTTDAAAARREATNLLGRTWTPIAYARDTMLAGTDITLSAGAVWTQAEWMWLASNPIGDAPTRKATAGSLEVAYTLPWRAGPVAFQLAARGEHADPDLDADDDAYTIATGGLNILPSPSVRVSAFGQGTLYRDADTGGDRSGAELHLRLGVGF